MAAPSSWTKCEPDSRSTSVAHLAGALGKPVWTLIPFSPDFRWMLDREDTPWYPTMRLFRQPTAGDWDAVIARVAREVASQKSSPPIIRVFAGALFGKLIRVLDLTRIRPRSLGSQPPT